MTKDEVLEAMWSDFASLLGLVDHGHDMDNIAEQQYFRIPYTEKPMKPNVLFDLYIQGLAIVGE